MADELWCLAMLRPTDPTALRRFVHALHSCIADLLSQVEAGQDGVDIQRLHEPMLDAARRVASPEGYVSRDRFLDAFGVEEERLRDGRGLYSRPRLLAAYYGRYGELTTRLRELLSPLDLGAIDLFGGLGVAEPILTSARPLLTLRFLRGIRELIGDHLAEDVDTTARALHEIRMQVDRSATSHRGLVRAVEMRQSTNSEEERALASLDIYRRMIEGQWGQWAWTLLQIRGRSADQTPGISSLREQLLSEEEPVLVLAAEGVPSDLRNAAAHEDVIWNARHGCLELGDELVEEEVLLDGTERAYAFMCGAEAALVCARLDSAELVRHMDSIAMDRRPRTPAEQTALNHFGTNGLVVRSYFVEGDEFTVLLEDIPFSAINPTFQAVMWASRYLPDHYRRFRVLLETRTRPAMDLQRYVLDRTFAVWRVARRRFEWMPMATFLPANARVRMDVELPDRAARAATWLAVNDAADAFDWTRNDSSPITQRLGMLAKRLEVVSTAVRATIDVLPHGAVQPLEEVLPVFETGLREARAGVLRPTSTLLAVEGQLRDIHESQPPVSVLPTVDDRPLSEILGSM